MFSLLKLLSKRGKEMDSFLQFRVNLSLQAKDLLFEIKAQKRSFKNTQLFQIQQQEKEKKSAHSLISSSQCANNRSQATNSINSLVPFQKRSGVFSIFHTSIDVFHANGELLRTERFDGVGRSRWFGHFEHYMLQVLRGRLVFFFLVWCKVEKNKGLEGFENGWKDILKRLLPNLEKEKYLIFFLPR